MSSSATNHMKDIDNVELNNDTYFISIYMLFEIIDGQFFHVVMLLSVQFTKKSACE